VARITTLVGIGVAAILLMAPAVAGAQDGPSSVEYDPANELVVGAAGDSGDPGASAGGDSALNDPVVSSLPFTGFDVLAMALGAIVITGTGLALRRLTRAPQTRQ
jgi:hypothetical protein